MTDNAGLIRNARAYIQHNEEWMQQNGLSIAYDYIEKLADALAAKDAEIERAARACSEMGRLMRAANERADAKDAEIERLQSEVWGWKHSALVSDDKADRARRAALEEAAALANIYSTEEDIGARIRELK